MGVARLRNELVERSLPHSARVRLDYLRRGMGPADRAVLERLLVLVSCSAHARARQESIGRIRKAARARSSWWRRWLWW